MTSTYLLRIKAGRLYGTAENELLKATINYHKSGGLCLTSVKQLNISETDKVLKAKKILSIIIVIYFYELLIINNTYYNTNH